MTYKEYRLKARQSLAGNWGIAIIVTLLAALLGGLIAGSTFILKTDEDTLKSIPESFVLSYLFLALGISLVQMVLCGPVRLGYASFLLKLHDGQEVDAKDLFSQFHRFGAGFCLAFLQGLFVLLWTLLFIIPGIIAAYSYAMAPYIMAENPGLSARECLKESREMMRGYKGELFILGLTFIGWNLLNILTLGIGSLWLNPYINAAYTAFYRDISRGVIRT